MKENERKSVEIVTVKDKKNTCGIRKREKKLEKMKKNQTSKVKGKKKWQSVYLIENDERKRKTFEANIKNGTEGLP